MPLLRAVTCCYDSRGRVPSTNFLIIISDSHENQDSLSGTNSQDAQFRKHCLIFRVIA
jgi:hypothetical protein